jgi:hypothetical protein
MKKQYIAKLPVDLQTFVIDIEREAGIDIRVAVDDSRTGRYLGEPDPLACNIDEDGATILIPHADYFPDGSVLHELLHINRLLVEQVPQINICDTHWDPQLETVFRQLDNNLEHLVIVPEELRRRPARRDRWISVIERTLSEIRSGKLQQADRDFLGIYTLAFIEHVLNDSCLRERSESILDGLGLRDRAVAFREAIIPGLASKEATTRICVEQFRLLEDPICFEYLDSRSSSRRQVGIK